VALREHGQFDLGLSMAHADGTNNENLEAYLQAAARCQRVCFLNIRNVANESSFRTLLFFLPSFRMRHVSLVFDLDFTVAHHTSPLIHALSSNSRILSVQAEKS